MNITAQQVNELRKVTGSGMMDCKKALAETGGDMEKAIDYLRKKGAATAEKRADRATNQGAVEAYIHAGGRIVSLLEGGYNLAALSGSACAFIRELRVA